MDTKKYISFSDIDTMRSRDDFDFQAGGGEQIRGTPHPEEGDVLHGAATEFALAESSEVLAGDVGDMGQAVEGPVFGQFARDFFPKLSEPAVALPGANESENIGLDEIEPVVDGFG